MAVMVFSALNSWDIRDPDVGTPRARTLGKWPPSVVLDTEFPECPAFWVVPWLKLAPAQPESAKGGVGSSGGGVGSTVKPSSKTCLGPSTGPQQPMIRSPPLLGNPCHLKERGTDQTSPNFRGVQKWFWRARSIPEDLST